MMCIEIISNWITQKTTWTSLFFTELRTKWQPTHWIQVTYPCDASNGCFPISLEWIIASVAHLALTVCISPPQPQCCLNKLTLFCRPIYPGQSQYKKWFFTALAGAKLVSLTYSSSSAKNREFIDSVQNQDRRWSFIFLLFSSSIIPTPTGSPDRPHQAAGADNTGPRQATMRQTPQPITPTKHLAKHSWPQFHWDGPNLTIITFRPL